MQLHKKRGLYEAGRVTYLSLDDIQFNPASSRKDPDAEGVRELARSIAKYGVLQPLTVRRLQKGYELVSGERRMQAAMLAGLKTVPCIVLKVGEEESAALVLVENLQRRDLSFVEEAKALERLRQLYGYSQEEMARLIGRSQPTVANKLRLLKLPIELLNAVKESGLTERHARVLLRLPKERQMAAALGRMIADDMNVAQAEEYVENLLEPEVSPPAEEKEPVIKAGDPRFFINSLERGADTMRRSGVDVDIHKEEDEGEIIITVRIREKMKIAAMRSRGRNKTV